ncbi:UNC93-like protein 3 [Vitis vinifera]|uniref:UNC93-like protein 3 n=1 Tax=Vitis vinifera TaxID=29760 RepID=A0A438IPR7_VITVI|nr:UNC93-like protein 3 [Vitis vinifera]
MDSVDSRDEESPLVVSDSQSKTLQNHTRDVHILSCSFLLIFLAYGATQNLESSVNTVHDGSGFCIPWFCCFSDMGRTGTYLTATARSHANDNNLHEGTVIGNFNGEFWGMFASHQFAGNLITLALLKDGTKGSAGGTTLLFIVFLCSMTLGTILMWFLRRRDNKGEEGSLEPAVGSTLMQCLCRMFTGCWSTHVWSIVNHLDSFSGAFAQVIVLLWILLKYRVTSGVLGTIYPLLMAAIWGIGDGVFNTQINALIGFSSRMIRKEHLHNTRCGRVLQFQLSFPQPIHLTASHVGGDACSLFTAFSAFLFLTHKVERAFSSSTSPQVAS